ncbi:sodium:proton antiporter NhaD [Lutimonas zeaxanthinifaciens]|uniref:sodium:proton antiporter NhaD n=1 Tax=Lutimonas zeaxanthinifaciens TaxID=3060215 RepID=UPI00265D17A2|nr:sodium:proton antiporter NhaD [Lutimonas sp. YSD2104]WKK65378.1 sodium:proton antiporter NhaD [Lutimonas sp. YSD2104]
MESLVIIVFVLGYLAITLEHNLKIDKLIPALGMMAVSWALISLGHLEVFEVNTEELRLEPSHLDEILLHHLGKTAEILIFLIGAMTIVEIIDYFNGFSAIKDFVRTNSKVKLLWIFSILAFILSAIIDNLTATIVLITILRKIIKTRDDRLWFAGLIVIAANAGGAWSPIGDVTTTMLWIGDKVTTLNLIKFLFIPSLLCMVVPALVASKLPAFKGNIEQLEDTDEGGVDEYSKIMLYLGLSAIVFVPVFKTVTHLPPYVGMMLSLAVVAVFAEIYSSARISLTSVDLDSDAAGHHSPVHKALSGIELPSILFFLGILMAVAALESLGILFNFANQMNNTVPMLGTEPNIENYNVSDLVVMLMGVASAVIDNVPLVAASIGMFSDPQDSPLWHFIAYSAGTGGSMLIIGSAAGVVAMGMEKINFFWYLKKISWLALIGFVVGAVTFMFMRSIL